MDLELNNNEKNINSNVFSEELKQHLENSIVTFSIDRFEENFAICENRQTGEFIHIPIDLLPPNCSKGSIIKFIDNKYVLDTESTTHEQEEIKKLVDNLFKRKK